VVEVEVCWYIYSYSWSPSSWIKSVTFLTFDLDLVGADGALRPELEEREPHILMIA
jgi:hypothetical protein